MHILHKLGKSKLFHQTHVDTKKFFQNRISWGTDEHLKEAKLKFSLKYHAVTSRWADTEREAGNK